MSDIFSSASDGPDLLTEELDLVRNMKLAIKEERYNDAGIFQISMANLLYESFYKLYCRFSPSFFCYLLICLYPFIK